MISSWCADHGRVAAIPPRANCWRESLASRRRSRREADAWNWHGPGCHYKKLPPPALAGAVQYVNAAGVVAAVTRLQGLLPVAESALRAGLVRLQLRGRFERHGDVVLDVAHNVEAARVLADNLRSMPSAAGKFRFVMGMLSDKPVEAFGAALAPLAVKFYAAGLPPPRGIAGAQLARRIGGSGVATQAFDTVEQAFAAAREEAMPGEAIVVCGSFVTVAAVAGQFHG